MIVKPMLFNGIFLGVWLALAAPLQAGTIAGQAVEIESLLAAGDSAGALASAADIAAEVWDATKDIGIRQALLVSQPAAGYGIYNPRPNENYKVGEPILVYAEPYGFGYGSGGAGIYTIGFVVDLRVLTEDGRVLAMLPAIARLDWTVRSKIREFQANVTYTLAGIAPGRYVLETTLHDTNSAKSGTFQNSIEITE